MMLGARTPSWWGIMPSVPGSLEGFISFLSSSVDSDLELSFTVVVG